MKESTGTRLKKIMKEKGLKQVDILKMCEPYCKKYNIKLEKNDLSQYVNDKVQPKQDKLSILGMALNVPEIWLMGFDVPMVETPTITIEAETMLSIEEMEIAMAYRKAPELTKEAAANVLGVKRKEKPGSSTLRNAKDA